MQRPWRKIRWTLCFLVLGSCLFFSIGRLLIGFPWTLRSAVNVKQRDFFFFFFMRWTYSQCQDLPDIVIKDTVSNQHIPCRISQLLLRFSGFVKELVWRMLFAGQPRCFLIPFLLSPSYLYFTLCLFKHFIQPWLTFWNGESPFKWVRFNSLSNTAPSEKCHWVLSM